MVLNRNYQKLILIIKKYKIIKNIENTTKLITIYDVIYDVLIDIISTIIDKNQKYYMDYYLYVYNKFCMSFLLFIIST